MTELKFYQIEVIWNREFSFVPFALKSTDLAERIKYANIALRIGDGAVFKKVRIVDNAGNVVWPEPIQKAEE